MGFRQEDLVDVNLSPASAKAGAGSGASSCACQVCQDGLYRVWQGLLEGCYGPGIMWLAAA